MKQLLIVQIEAIKIACPRCREKDEYNVYKIEYEDRSIGFVRGCVKCCYSQKWRRGEFILNKLRKALEIK